MPPKTKQLKLTPTPEFLKWFQEFRSGLDMTEGEALAWLIRLSAQENGFEGDVMNFRGKYDRELAGLMKYADKVTDFGANDPIHYVEEDENV